MSENVKTTPVTYEQALEALDNMDDCARMATGIDAFGPRECLRRFIEQTQCQPPGPVGVYVDIPGDSYR